MNKIIIVGNIGKDAEVAVSSSGKSYTKFSVGESTKSRDKTDTIWFTCRLWGSRGEAIAQYLTKGTKVTLIGRLGVFKKDDGQILTVEVDDIDFSGSKQQHTTRQAYDTTASSQLDEAPF